MTTYPNLEALARGRHPETEDFRRATVHEARRLLDERADMRSAIIGCFATLTWARSQLNSVAYEELIDDIDMRLEKLQPFIPTETP